MSGKGEPHDNAVVGNFFSSLKNELTHHVNFRDINDAKAAVFDYIESGGADQTLADYVDTNAIFGVEITDDDILVSDDNSERAMISYFSALSNIISQTKKNLEEKIQESSSGLDLNLYKEAAEAYTNAFVEAKKLIVPSFWKDTHKKELELMAESKKVFEALSFLNQDPVKSWRAVQHYILLHNEGLQLENDIKARGTQLINSFK